MSQNLEKTGWFCRQFYHLVSFAQSSTMRSGLLLFFTPSTCLTSSTTFIVMVISLKFKTPQGCGDILFHSLEGIFYFFGYFRLNESHNVCIRLNFRSILSDCYFLLSETFYFLKATVISLDVSKDGSLLLITLFEMFNLSCAYALHFVEEEVQFEDIISMTPAVHLNKQITVSSLFDSPRSYSV